MIDKDEDGLAGNEEGVAFFNSSWLPGSDPKPSLPKEKKNKRKEPQDAVALEEDIVEDFVLSSDDDEDEDSMINTHAQDMGADEQKPEAQKSHGKKQKKISKVLQSIKERKQLDREEIEEKKNEKLRSLLIPSLLF